jgi:mRNA-degrading endonuclease HigB of HigAB toxin-antitoxin module
MTTLVRFNIKFNFDLDKSITFVCQSREYNKICKELSRQFENFEKNQFEERSLRNGLLPDERLYRRLTSKHSILRREEYTHRQSNKSLTIMISRDEDDSWVFKVVDLNGKKYRLVIHSPEKNTIANWRPGDYAAYDLFRFIGMRYAFGEESVD